MNAVVTSRTDRFVQQACALPAMPEVANKLLRSFDRDDLSLNELAGLIGRDQTLSARVLRLANSARYSPSRSVTSLNDAAMALGTRTLRDLALSACMVGMFPSIPGFDRLAFWRTTLATAAYAQPLARFLQEDEDAAYLGGLMLRTGQLLMMMVDPDMTQRIGRLSLEIDSRISFENSLLGCSHPEITAELARHWRFPNVLVTAFNAAAHPMEIRPFSRMGAVLRLAGVIAEARERERDPMEALQSTHPDLVQHLKLDMDWLTAHLPDHRLAVASVDDLMH